MRFGITRINPRKEYFEEISQQDYLQGKAAKEGYMALLGIEEKLDIVLENYAEYERELLSLALNRSIFHDPDWSSIINDIHTVNRRLANLLTTGRLYIDQVKHDIMMTFGQESSVNRSLRERLQRASQVPGFRVMEELRNYIQHRGLIVTRITYPGKAAFSISDEGDRRVTALKWGVTPSLSIEALREDKKLKRFALDELEARGEHIPVTPLVRQYIEELGSFHKDLRETTALDLEKWRELLRALIERGQKCFKNDLTAVALVAEDEKGEFVGIEHIFEDLLKRHTFLARKNLTLSRFSLQFVSGECGAEEE